MKKPKRAKRAARLSPYQHMTSCCVRGWGGRKPEPCGGGLITAWTRTPAFHRCSFPVAGDAQTTAAYYQIPPLWSPGEGQGILSITAEQCQSEAASQSSSPSCVHPSILTKTSPEWQPVQRVPKGVNSVNSLWRPCIGLYAGCCCVTWVIIIPV